MSWSFLFALVELNWDLKSFVFVFVFVLLCRAGEGAQERRRLPRFHGRRACFGVCQSLFFHVFLQTHIVDLSMFLLALLYRLAANLAPTTRVVLLNHECVFFFFFYARLICSCIVFFLCNKIIRHVRHGREREADPNPSLPWAQRANSLLLGLGVFDFVSSLVFRRFFLVSALVFRRLFRGGFSWCLFRGACFAVVFVARLSNCLMRLPERLIDCLMNII
jgi:hypothetical protein